MALTEVTRFIAMRHRSPLVEPYGSSWRARRGVRKLRWRAPGRGKRGGYRVIYCAKTAQRVIWMLTMYPKNVADNIPAQVLRQIRKEVEDG